MATHDATRRRCRVGGGWAGRARRDSGVRRRWRWLGAPSGGVLRRIRMEWVDGSYAGLTGRNRGRGTAGSSLSHLCPTMDVPTPTLTGLLRAQHCLLPPPRKSYPFLFGWIQIGDETETILILCVNSWAKHGYGWMNAAMGVDG